jgi:hypothetical protein
MNTSLQITPLWLRDTYARVQSDPMFTLEGYTGTNLEAETKALESITSGFSEPNLFIGSNNIFAYLDRTVNLSLCSNYISIVIPGLRDFYWNKRSLLSQEESIHLSIAMKNPSPSFKNIFDYKSLKQLRGSSFVPMFQLYGNITVYDVVHVPVSHFLECINSKSPISIQLEGVPIGINLMYSDFDFWDPDQQKVINNIDISRCYK